MSTQIPTLKQILEGYAQFNEWERSEQRAQLRQLSVDESLRQFFQLCNLVRPLQPDSRAEERFIEQSHASWIALRRRLQHRSMM